MFVPAVYTKRKLPLYAIRRQYQIIMNKRKTQITSVKNKSRDEVKTCPAFLWRTHPRLLSAVYLLRLPGRNGDKIMRYPIYKMKMSIANPINGLRALKISPTIPLTSAGINRGKIQLIPATPRTVRVVFRNRLGVPNKNSCHPHSSFLPHYARRVTLPRGRHSA
jgi:hypothetical protein